jgi:hypothetical protein
MNTLSYPLLIAMETPWITITIFVDNKFFASMFCPLEDYVPLHDHCAHVIPGAMIEVPQPTANDQWVACFYLPPTNHAVLTVMFS